jgi:hypothetical protein
MMAHESAPSPDSANGARGHRSGSAGQYMHLNKSVQEQHFTEGAIGAARFGMVQCFA